MCIRKALCILVLLLAGVGGATQVVAAPETVLVGVVTAQYANQVVFKTNAAVVYRAEASYAGLVRRNGGAIAVTDIAVGDRVEVRGQVWSDNSMSASAIRNLTLYTHAGTFSGKIMAVDQPNKSISLQSAQHSKQTIRTTAATLFTRNGTITTFQDMQVGMSATVHGTWERNKTEVIADSIRARVRLINIDITGDVTMKDGSALTVVANGVLYAVDAGNAVLRSKNNKVMYLTDLGLEQVRVWGKHMAESPSITAARIKSLRTVK